jgi:ATP-dependent RNA helicase DDX31/DBP7
MKNKPTLLFCVCIQLEELYNNAWKTANFQLPAMADDGMLLNYDLSETPLLPKQSFQGGRWKDRLAAKKVSRHRLAKGSKPPRDREIFKDGQHVAQIEDYVELGASQRPAKRPRVERDPGRSANIAAMISGKLPLGSINVRGERGTSIPEVFKAPEKTKPRGTQDAFTQDSSRPALMSGKLPPGSIKISTSGERPGRISFAANYKTNIKSWRSSTSHNRDEASGKPQQIISSLFSFNPSSKVTTEVLSLDQEPITPSNAPLTDEMVTFTTLGLSRRLAAHLATKLGMKAPTAIQKTAIPQLISDDSDAFIQAQTGSGKTLAYLLPIVERIIAISRNDTQVHRDSGLFAIVLAPTRELCKQIAFVLETILRCAPWIVGTTVIGGESKQSEKARLRKGVNILIATPGRLADHLDNTEVLNVTRVRWLVLDEGDRLMELGFEEEIRGIVEEIGRRTLGLDKTGVDLKSLPCRKVTILCSATMKMNVQRLGEISLEDAVHIHAIPIDGNPREDMDDDASMTEKVF